MRVARSHRRGKTRLLQFLLAAALAVAVFGGTARAASASSWLWASGGKPVDGAYQPYSWAFYYSMPSLTPARMICWVDSQWYTGNYRSPRWFKVDTIYGRFYVHSSYVYSQTRVPHC